MAMLLPSSSVLLSHHQPPPLLPSFSTSSSSCFSSTSRNRRRNHSARNATSDDDKPISADNPTRRCISMLAVATATGAFQSLTALAAPAPPQISPALPNTMVSKILQSLVVADLDAGTAKVAIAVTGPALSALSFLFIARIVMSWYPKLPVGKFPYVVAYAPTEPFLSATRKVIPPLGGVDVTPVVWFGLVSFLNEILVGPQGLLVLLSQQV